MKNEKELNIAVRFGICGLIIVSLISIIFLFGVEVKKQKAEKANWKLLDQLSE